MLDSVKLALRITSDAYDAELETLIAAALQDLKISGIIADPTDPMIKTAVATYCRIHFGSPDDYDKLAQSYEQIKGLLWAADGHTRWGKC